VEDSYADIGPIHSVKFTCCADHAYSLTQAYVAKGEPVRKRPED
jgi:hypothetical protein